MGGRKKAKAVELRLRTQNSLETLEKEATQLQLTDLRRPTGQTPTLHTLSYLAQLLFHRQAFLSFCHALSHCTGTVMSW